MLPVLNMSNVIETNSASLPRIKNGGNPESNDIDTGKKMSKEFSARKLFDIETAHSKSSSEDSVEKEIKKLQASERSKERRISDYLAHELDKIMKADIEQEKRVSEELGLLVNLGLSPTCSVKSDTIREANDHRKQDSQISGQSSDKTNVQIHDDQSFTKTSTTSTTKAMNNSTEIQHAFSQMASPAILPHNLNRISQKPHSTQGANTNLTTQKKPNNDTQHKSPSQSPTNVITPQNTSRTNIKLPTYKKSMQTYSNIVSSHSNHMKILEDARKQAIEKIQENGLNTSSNFLSQSQSNLTSSSSPSSHLQSSDLSKPANQITGRNAESNSLENPQNLREETQSEGLNQNMIKLNQPSNTEGPLIFNHAQHMDMLDEVKEHVIHKMQQENKITEIEETNEEVLSSMYDQSIETEDDQSHMMPDSWEHYGRQLQMIHDENNRNNPQQINESDYQGGDEASSQSIEFSETNKRKSETSNIPEFDFLPPEKMEKYDHEVGTGTDPSMTNNHALLFLQSMKQSSSATLAIESYITSVATSTLEPMHEKNDQSQPEQIKTSNNNMNKRREEPIISDGDASSSIHSHPFMPPSFEHPLLSSSFIKVSNSLGNEIESKSSSETSPEKSGFSKSFGTNQALSLLKKEIEKDQENLMRETENLHGKNSEAFKRLSKILNSDEAGKSDTDLIDEEQEKKGNEKDLLYRARSGDEEYIECETMSMSTLTVEREPTNRRKETFSARQYLQRTKQILKNEEFEQKEQERRSNLSIRDRFIETVQATPLDSSFELERAINISKEIERPPTPIVSISSQNGMDRSMDESLEKKLLPTAIVSDSPTEDKDIESQFKSGIVNDEMFEKSSISTFASIEDKKKPFRKIGSKEFRSSTRSTLLFGTTSPLSRSMENETSSSGTKLTSELQSSNESSASSNDEFELLSGSFSAGSYIYESLSEYSESLAHSNEYISEERIPEFKKATQDPLKPSQGIDCTVSTLTEDTDAFRFWREEEHRAYYQRFATRTPSKPPDLLDDIDKSRWSALHKHIVLLFARPELIPLSMKKVNTNDLSTPLHSAVWMAPPALSILMIKLAAKCEGVLESYDKDKNTPLHLCAANLQSVPNNFDLNTSFHFKDKGYKSRDKNSNDGGDQILDTKVLSTLVEAAPSTVQSQNSAGDTPLHLLVSFTQDSKSDESEKMSIDDAVIILLNVEPNVCNLQDKTGATPLHLAIANNCSECVLNSFVSCCPEACAIQDENGMLPLHYVAAFNQTPLKSVKRIFEANPNAIFQVSRNGDTPLHIAVSNAASNIVTTDGKVKKKSLKLFEYLVVSLDLRFQSNNMQDPLSMRNKEKVSYHGMPRAFCIFALDISHTNPLWYS